MRVALVDPSLFTLPYDVALAAALRQEGVSVSLYGRALRPEDGGDGGVAVQPLFYRATARALAAGLPRRLSLVFKGLDHLVSMRALLARLRVERPDVIHFQWLPLPLVDRHFLRLFRRIAPLVLTVHDTDPFNGSPTARLQRAGFARSLHAVDRLIVHTAQGAARLEAMGVPSARVSLLPHGPLASPPPEAGADAMEGPVTFVLFGKIKPYKGADVLIEAFAALSPEQRAQARVRIIGQAYMDLQPLHALARRLGVADEVAIDEGFVGDDEVAAVFHPGSVAAFPYREIEASGVLSLALAAGRPILASRLGSFAETLTDGVQGRLLPPAEPQALCAAMAALIDDRTMAARWSAAARATAEAAPGWREIARMTRKLYADAMEQGEVRSAAAAPHARVLA